MGAGSWGLGAGGWGLRSRLHAVTHSQSVSEVRSLVRSFVRLFVCVFVVRSFVCCSFVRSFWFVFDVVFGGVGVHVGGRGGWWWSWSEMLGFEFGFELVLCCGSLVWSVRLWVSMAVRSLATVFCVCLFVRQSVSWLVGRMRWMMVVTDLIERLPHS